MARVVLAMSGGVDSSVAAHLLQQQGHDVSGVFMRRGEHPPAAPAAVGTSAAPSRLPLGDVRAGDVRADDNQACRSEADVQDARRVAERLKIPFQVLDLQGEFSQIIGYFVAEYTAGRTPNPCAMCNARLKFGKLFEYADSVGAEFLATGHYARMSHSPAFGAQLLRGVDVTKDQSYALFGVQRKLLRRMLLPVGEYEKSQIRELAENLGLQVADKPDSQEICFVAAGEHSEFVRQHRDAGIDTSGEFVSLDGRVLGRHPGIECFTVGQRKGLGVALGERAFVVRIERDTCRVVLGRHEDLARRDVTADRTNWLADLPQGPFRCQAKIRYNAAPAPATAEVLPGERLSLHFDEPRYGVAPGQAVVCYDDDRVLGGGWIESPGNSAEEQRSGASSRRV
jgi:tRNA-uridine 2-sulfurtransferase